MSPEVKTKPPPEVKAEAKPEAKPAASQATFSNPNRDGVPWPQTWKLIASRFLALSDKAGRRMMQRTLKIGISERLPSGGGAKGLRWRMLQYLEESIAQWVMSPDVLVFMIPTVYDSYRQYQRPGPSQFNSPARLRQASGWPGPARRCRCLSPQSYAEAATRPEWRSDRVCDMYELELLHEFIEAGKPVLAICRSCQLINVAFGGTLYQGIATDVPTSITHVNDEYDRLHP